MNLEDVSTWLRHRVLRLRTILAKDTRAESGLRELIADCGSRGTPRTVGREARFTNSDRLFFIQLYRWFPSVLRAITIIRPQTIVRWHRAGFRRYWRWKSQNLGGRPQISAELRALSMTSGRTWPWTRMRLWVGRCGARAIVAIPILSGLHHHYVRI
jgi:hypothetical protein